MAPLRPGELRVQRDGVQAGTGTAPALLGDVQPDGSGGMRAADWARGCAWTCARGCSADVADRGRAGSGAGRGGSRRPAGGPSAGGHSAGVRAATVAGTARAAAAIPPAGWRWTCAAVAERDAYANLLLPELLAQRGLTAGTPRSRPS